MTVIDTGVTGTGVTGTRVADTVAETDFSAGARRAPEGA